MRSLLFLIILGILVQPSTVSASDLSRSCPGADPQAPCTEFWRYDAVFIGKVKKLVNEPFPEGTSVNWQQYRKVTATISVEEIFRGQAGTEVVFEMEDCYFEFKQDEKYLIYTNKEEGGKFGLRRHWGRTRPLSEAGEDLDFIRSLPRAPSGGRIYGDVYDHRGSVTLRVSNEDSTNSKMIGVAIYLQRGEMTYQTISDANGHYEFTGIPPGSYELSTDLPDFLSGTRHSLTAIDKGCVKANLSVQATGEIRGRLIGANGEPVDNAVVSIFSVDGVTEDMFDRVRPHFMTRDETDKDGSFRFVRLQSGRYYLAVNMVEIERRKNSRAVEYPRVFYPGTTLFKDAKPITLADGSKLKDVEIKLPALTPSPSSRP